MNKVRLTEQDGIAISSKQYVAIKNGIIAGLEIASGAKSSATSLHKKEEQIAAVKAQIVNLYSLSKELPLILALQNGVTGYFVQQVLFNELKSGAYSGSVNIVPNQEWYDNDLQDKAIFLILDRLEKDNGLPYVLRLFTELVDNKINNARTKRTILTWLLNHDNIEFISIKYRNKLQKILTHVWGNKTAYALINNFNTNNTVSGHVVHTNVFKYLSLDNSDIINLANRLNVKNAILHIFGVKVKGGLYDQYNSAKKDIFASPNIPEEVLIGLLSDQTHPQYLQLWSTEEKRKTTIAKIREFTKATTANIQIRQTKSNEKNGADVEVNVAKVTDFMALYKTGYESGFTNEINTQIINLAKKKKLDIPYKNIGVIIDKSISMRGHKQESKNTPLAIVDFTAKVLELSSDMCVLATTSQISDLSLQFLQVVENFKNERLDAIFILSDGYENSYDGLLDEVIDAWMDMTDTHLPIFHVSPITGNETGMKVRKLSNHASTIAINKPESLALQINSKLLESDIKMWLANQLKQLKKA